VLEPPVDGAIPVPAFPASAIPWEQVGDGWFLLAYDPEVEPFVPPDDGTRVRFRNLDATLMLVSPAGDLYHVRSLDGFGPGGIEGWDEDGLLVLDGSAEWGTDESYHGPLSVVSLQAGTATIVNADVVWFDGLAVLLDGRWLTRTGWDDSMSLEVQSADFAARSELCRGDWFLDARPSPDGARTVCLARGPGDKTAVTVYDLSTGVGSIVDAFTYDPGAYSTHGWWDPDSFVVTRLNDAGATLWWAYDVSTKKLRDLNATLSDGTPAETAQGVAGYRVVATGALGRRAVATGDAVEIQGFDGSLRATLPCLPSAISGHIALALCWDWEHPGTPMDIVVANLETGTLTTVASFVAGEGTDIRVFPAPAGEQTGVV
jgi:hypothetical protein